MESTVLYRAAIRFEWYWIVIPALLIAFGIVAIHFMKKVRKAKENGQSKEMVDSIIAMAIGLSGVSFLLLCTLILIPIKIGEYHATIGAFEKGEYEIVEGYVEDFHPMAYIGHGDNETFRIKDVTFSYSDYEIHFGYNISKFHGGVITGDGQHLKIGYTKYGSYGNIIVYIEELP